MHRNATHLGYDHNNKEWTICKEHSNTMTFTWKTTRPLTQADIRRITGKLPPKKGKSTK